MEVSRVFFFLILFFTIPMLNISRWEMTVLQLVNDHLRYTKNAALARASSLTKESDAAVL